MKDYLSIGEVAKLKDVSIQALRYYDREGILTPSYVAPSNYRYYKAEQLKELDMIRFALRIGLELKNLVPLFKRNDMDTYQKMLELTKQNIVNEINDLKSILSNLEIVTDEIEETKKIKGNTAAYYKYVKGRRVATLPKEVKDGEDHYTQYRDNMRFDPPDSYGIFRECGYLCEYAFGKFKPVSCYIILDDEYMADKTVTEIPSGKYLCCNYNKENKEEAMHSLFEELNAAGVTPAFAVETQLVDRIADTDSSYYELQVLIK